MDIVQLIIIGLVVGSIIALGSMGLTLAYGITKFANVAHGDYMTLGMFTAFVVVNQVGLSAEPIGPFSFGWTLVVGIVLAALVVGTVASVLDVVVYRVLRRRNASTLTALVASIGVALMLRAYVQAQWGEAPLRYTSAINRALTLPGGLKIKPDQIFMLVLMVVVAAGLYLLLYRTRLGKSIRATSDNPALAGASGVDTDKVRLVMWFFAGGLAAISGVLLAVQSQLRHDAGFEFLLPLFSAVILGGIGNPWGALVGGLIVGVSQEVSTYWIPTGLKEAVPFIVLTIALLLRPRGIFGSQV